MNSQSLPILYGADCFDRVEPALHSNYSALVEELWIQLRPDGSEEPAPELLVVHSPVARPMSVRSETGAALVYDQYMGQMFSRLTRMTLCDAPPEAVDAYVFKLYGQRLLVCGRFLEAAAFGVVSATLMQTSNYSDALKESEEQLAYRSASTYVQEAFTIAHELMHLVLTDDEVAAGLAEMYSEVVEENIARVIRAGKNGAAEFHRQYLSDMAEAIKRRGMNATDIGSAFSLPPSHGGEDEADRRQLAERMDVQREGMCDLYGAIAVAEVLNVPGMDYLDVMATATLAVQHLRLVQILDETVAGGSEDAVGLELSQSMARTSLLRTGLGVSLSVSLQGHGEVAQTVLDKLHEKAVRLNRAHTSVVLDQLLFGLDLPLLGEKFLADEAIAAQALELAADEKALRGLLGFHSRPK